MGVADADRPRTTERRHAANRDVAAAVDEEVGVTVAFQNLGRVFDRPALDHARRIEVGAVRCGHGQGVKRTVGLEAEALAEQEHGAHLLGDVVETELPAAKA